MKPKKTSSVQKGTYYKGRTKKWLEEQGYSVGSLEKMMCVKKNIFIKKDQFASDLLAVGNGQVIFVQVKSGKTALYKVKEAIREFAKFDFPEFADRWVVCWVERVRKPIIVDIKNIPAVDNSKRVVNKRIDEGLDK